MAAAYVSCHTMQVRKRSDKRASEQMWLQLKQLEEKKSTPTFTQLGIYYVVKIQSDALLF